MVELAPVDEAVEAESTLIGLALFGHALPDELPRLPREAWAHAVMAEAWLAIGRLHRDGHRIIAPHQVAAAVDREGLDEAGRAALRQMIEACQRTAPIVGQGSLALALDDLARTVRGLAAKRQLKAVAGDIARLAEDPTLTAADALAKVERDLSALRIGEALAPTTLRELVVRLAEEVERPREVMPTGIGRLDEALAGGLWTGKLYGFAARMKVGKTLLAVTAARNIARSGRKVLYVALEMGQAEVAQRVIADWLGTNAVAFLRRDDEFLSSRLVGYAVRKDAPELDNLLFRDAPGMTFDQLRGIAQAAVTQHGIKLMVVDYWQLVQGCPKGQSETQHLSTVAQWMADFARRSGIAIVTPAQINRSGETRGSDGLRLACDWYGHMHPAEQAGPRDRWIEALDSRYTLLADIGGANDPALYVDTVGPVMHGYGG